MSRWSIKGSRPHDPQAQDQPGGPRREPVDAGRLVATCVDLADTLSQDFDLVEFLYTLVERCVELLDVSAVGLMLADDRGRLRVMASSTEEMRLLELFQLQNQEGPCLECYQGGQAVDEPDLAAAAHERWPRFASEAIRRGLRAGHALPMRLRTQTVGALNLFHADPGGLHPGDIEIAQGLVDVATIGLIQVQLHRRREVLLDQVRTALDARVMIEQAKGILAEDHQISPTAAFALLRVHARDHHRRLTELAHAVIEHAPEAAELRNTAALTGATHTEATLADGAPPRRSRA